jgi:RecB family exonuclease
MQAITATQGDPGLPGPQPGDRSNNLVKRVLLGEPLFDVVEHPRYFSFSAFDLFDRCPRQYALRYLCGLSAETPNLAFAFGSAAHAAFERFTKARRERSALGRSSPSRDELAAFFEDACAPSDDLVALEGFAARTQNMLDRFWRAETVAGESRETIAEEVRFRISLALEDGSEVRVGGCLDRADRLASGGVEVIDYKTGPAWWAGKAQDSLQLSVYALACRDSLRLGTPERVSLYFVEHDLRSSAVPTDEQLDALRDNLRDRAVAIRGSDFPPAASSRACRNCDFGRLCRVEPRKD